MPFGCLIAHCTFLILPDPACHLHKFRSHGLLSTLFDNFWCMFLKFAQAKSNAISQHLTFGCLHCIYNACTHLIICLIHTHIYTWLVRQKQVIKEQDSTLGLKEPKNASKFSICDQVKSSIRRDSVPGTLYQMPTWFNFASNQA